jgi:multicomponent Na+:H+ antiporter subunit G
MSEIISVGLMVIGVVFMLLAAVGIVRMPDLLTRMQTTTKASTLGIGCLLIGVMIHFAELGVSARVVAIIAFVFLTAPVAAHVIARAGYRIRIPLWEGTVVDELKGKYRDSTVDS